MVKLPHWPSPLGYRDIDLGLGRVYALLEKLGNPHLKLPPVVHIAGTNGKGSTLAFLKAILEAAGLRVHRYCSPHLVQFNERIHLAGSDISDDYLHDVLERCRIAAGDIPVTFFEGTTIAAMLAFSETPADVVLLETGMGGRLDATNVILQPALTIITPVGMDHMEFLGDSVAKIAYEKAAIMKRGVPCVLASQMSEAMPVFTDYAANIGASLYTEGKDWHAVSAETKLGLYGAHQHQNAGCAVAVLHHFPFTISDAHIAEGLAKATWPARLQKLQQHPLNTLHDDIWLDGSHNEAGAEVLAEAMRAWKQHGIQIHLVMGMLSSKDAQAFLALLAEQASSFTAIPIYDEPKCYTPAQLCAIAREVGIKIVMEANDVRVAVTGIISRNPQGTPMRILITGSLYLAGEVLAIEM